MKIKKVYKKACERYQKLKFINNKNKKKRQYDRACYNNL